jgi:hypothetical protein
MRMSGVPALSFWLPRRSSTKSRTAAAVCLQQDLCVFANTGQANYLGDYSSAMLIRVWMQTAVREEVTSFGTFLSTLSHELCHHLDFQEFGFHDSWHRRGFYERADVLYHHARGTPLKRLFWVSMAGGRWRIDWPKTNSFACREII